MKLIIILTVACCLDATAGAFSQSVTISCNKTPLEEVFSQIEKQTGYHFIYSTSITNPSRVVTMSVTNKPLADVLTDCLKGLGLTFKVEDQYIVIQQIPGESLPDSMWQVVEPKNFPVKGKVIDESGNPIEGVSVTVKGTALGVSTNSAGAFILNNVPVGAVLVISMVSYEIQEITLKDENPVLIRLKQAAGKLGEVQVVFNTGYQNVNSERAPGSFTKIDKDLLNRRVSTDLVSRLEGIASGLVFYRDSRSDQPTLNIRGRSTIFANATPLIVLDNFAFDGDINAINPNDIESMTLLKDAAAASIWGARAANGVIVITTKAGKRNQSPSVEFNTNVTISRKPDLFYLPRIAPGDFIEAEEIFFNQGYFNSNETSTLKPALSPVVELLIAKRDGKISPEEADRQIDALKSQDVRRDFEKYFLQNGIKQQYAVNVNGGGANSSYFFSAGYDNNKSEYVGNTYRRFTINSNNTFTLFNKLDLQAGLYFAQTDMGNNSSEISDFTDPTVKKFYPYAKLVDENGNPLVTSYGVRDSYKQLVQDKGFLNWNYKALDELNNSDNTIKQSYIKVNTGIRYRFLDNINLDIKYQLEKGFTTNNNFQGIETYYTRDLINTFFNPNTANANLKYPIPLGGIMDRARTDLTGHSGRIQAGGNFKWGNSEVSAVAGFEVKQVTTLNVSNRFYGYDPATMISQTVDYKTLFATNPSGTVTAVPFAAYNNNVALLDRYNSYYGNVAYTLSGRYTISGSGRIDKSNLFGVKFNQKSVPLWSSGFKWAINKEKFFNVNWLKQLALRATYGYNGNIDKSTTAYTTGRYLTGNALVPLAQASIQSPPNPELRWERVSIWNLGVDFSLNRIKGSIDFYRKKGIDLIGESTIDPTVGFNSFKGNLANMVGKGIDIDLTTNNITGQFSWATNWLFSYASDKVTKYNKPSAPNSYITNGAGYSSTISPFVGRPVFGVYSYPFAGLDHNTGDPLGYFKGAVSNSWVDIAFNGTPEELRYHGPARPTMFGSLRNTFTYRNFTLSFNLTYKLGYFFRRSSVNYSFMKSYWSGSKDFANRWKKPGDELLTNVPSVPNGPTNTYREYYFYLGSEVLVEKADHIRFQDINFSYSLDNSRFKKLPFRTLQFYLYVNNVGLLWKANKQGIDPDNVPDGTANFLPASRSFSLGARVNL